MLEILESWQREFGDIFCLPHDRHLFVCIASPTALETILKLPPSIMSSSQRGGIFEAILGPNALITLEGRPHQQHRRLMLPPFHGGGNRRCIGAEFAQLRMKLGTAAFLNTVGLQLDPTSFGQKPIKPVRYGMTMAPPPSLKVIKGDPPDRSLQRLAEPPIHSTEQGDG